MCIKNLCCRPFVFAITVDVITENAREGLMNKILFADNLVLMSESIDNLKEKCLKGKEAFESKGLKTSRRPKLPPSLCGRQVVGPSSLPVVVAPV